MANILCEPFFRVICTLIPFFPKFGGFFQFPETIIANGRTQCCSKKYTDLASRNFNYTSDRMSASWTLQSDILLSYRLILTVRPDGPH